MRQMATSSPSTSTTASTARKSLTSSQKPRATAGNDSTKTSQLKNVCWTSSQPGLLTTSAVSPPSTITVDTAATTMPRRAWRRRAASRATRRSAAVLSGGGAASIARPPALGR